MNLSESLLHRIKVLEQGHTLDAQDIEDALIAKFFEYCADVTVQLGESELKFNSDESSEDGDSLFEAVWGSLEGEYVYMSAVPFDKFSIQEIDSTRYKVEIEKIFEAIIETSSSEFAYNIEVPGLFGKTVLISKDNDGLITGKDLESVIEQMSEELEALAEVASSFTPEVDDDADDDEEESD